MFLRPLEHERHRPAWQLTLDDLQSPDIDDGFVLGIKSMEMRRRVILPA